MARPAPAVLAVLAWCGAGQAQAPPEPEGPRVPVRPACTSQPQHLWDDACWAQVCRSFYVAAQVVPRPAFWFNYAMAANTLRDTGAALEGARRCAEYAPENTDLRTRCRAL